MALVLEEIDRERVRVAEVMGFRAMTAREWLYIAYNASGRSLYDAISSNPGYRGIRAPHTINVRYITEDVPMSLVPISSLGREFGAETPTIDKITHMASLMHGCDYWKDAQRRSWEWQGLQSGSSSI